jgi:hypothetical protein
MMEVRPAFYLAELPPVESLDRLPRHLQPFFPEITNYLRTLRLAIAKAEQLQRASAARTTVSQGHTD